MNSTQQSNQPSAPQFFSLSSLLLFCKGLAMGIGDSVPGISGGTIAVITNIYDKLIYSIRSVDLQAAKLLMHGQLAALWQHVNGNFLLILMLGILSGLIISANTVLYLLENEFEALMAYFLGLVLASSWLLKDEFEFTRSRNLFALALGAALTLAVGMLSPRVGDLSLMYLFFSGAIAICAMILPGLSGAFILLLLGVYQSILNALLSIDVVSIAIFTSGCVVGLLSFSRILAWLLKFHHQLSYAGITGMLLGSITVLWPWQQALSSYVDSSGEEHVLASANVLPSSYAQLTGNAPEVGLAALCALAGLTTVILLHRVFNRPSDS